MIRFPKTAISALALSLAMTSAAGATDLTEMTDAERAAFRDEVRAYLMANPEVIIEAVNELERRQAEEQNGQDGDLIAANADAIFDDGFSHVGGNLEGDVTLVEFVDYRCGYCRKAHDEVKELVQTDGNIRMITKQFPILGPDSLASSQFAISVRQVGGDEAYELVNETLIKFNGKPTESNLRKIAEALDLDADAVISGMDAPEVARQIDATRALATKLGINGTPTFVMEDVMLRGYLPLDGMRQVVSQLRDDG